MLGLNFLLRSISVMISILFTDDIQLTLYHSNCPLTEIFKWHWFKLNQIHEWIFDYQVFGYLLQKSVHGLTELHKMAAVQACTLKHTEDQRLDACSNAPPSIFLDTFTIQLSSLEGRMMGMSSNHREYHGESASKNHKARKYNNTWVSNMLISWRKERLHFFSVNND